MTKWGRNKTLVPIIATGGLRMLVSPTSYRPGREVAATKYFRTESHILGNQWADFISRLKTLNERGAPSSNGVACQSMQELT